MSQIGIWMAFVAGVMSFLSPCVLPLGRDIRRGVFGPGRSLDLLQPPDPADRAIPELAFQVRAMTGFLERMGHFAKSRWKVSMGLVAVATIGYLIGLSQGPHTGDLPQTSRTTADFALPDLSGKTVRLSDFKDRVVLVDFWATWCLPCLAELPDLMALYRKYKDRGFTIVGISMDDMGKEVVGPFVRENQVPYPILLTGLDPVEGYPVRGLPTAYLIDRRGHVVKKYVGFKSPEGLEQDVTALLNGGNEGGF